MKKKLVILLAMMLCILLAGCGSKDESVVISNEAINEVMEAEDTTFEDVDNATGDVVDETTVEDEVDDVEVSGDEALETEEVGTSLEVEAEEVDVPNEEAKDTTNKETPIVEVVATPTPNVEVETPSEVVAPTPTPTMAPKPSGNNVVAEPTPAPTSTPTPVVTPAPTPIPTPEPTPEPVVENWVEVYRECVRDTDTHTFNLRYQETNTLESKWESYTEPHTWVESELKIFNEFDGSGQFYARTYVCGVCGKSSGNYVPGSRVDIPKEPTPTPTPTPCPHTWNGGVTTTSPSCTAEGVKTFTCTSCGDTKTESVAKTAHNYTHVEQAPTCYADGYSGDVCACGHAINGINLNRIEHTWLLTTMLQEATCGSNGFGQYVCQICNFTKNMATPLSTEHTGVWNIYESGCGNRPSKYYCSHCHQLKDVQDRPCYDNNSDGACDKCNSNLG